MPILPSTFTFSLGRQKVVYEVLKIGDYDPNTQRKQTFITTFINDASDREKIQS